MDDPLVIAGKEFRSRLMVGTGRHRTMEEMVESIEASGAEIITVAIRRLNLDNPNEKSILDYFDWDRYTILPNTAACRTAGEAVFVAKLARELTGSDWVKLEVIPEGKWLLPDPVGTYEAAKILVDDGSSSFPTSTPTPFSRCVWRTSAARRSCHWVRPSGLDKASSLSRRSRSSSSKHRSPSSWTPDLESRPKHLRPWKLARKLSSSIPQSHRPSIPPAWARPSSSASRPDVWPIWPDASSARKKLRRAAQPPALSNRQPLGAGSL